MPGRSPQGVFLSYRREDTGPYARSLQLQLSQRIPDAPIFMDLDSIEPGLDFAEAIEDAVNSCAVLVALIGQKWATLTDEDGGLRLDNPNDYVRFEVKAALERGVRVIPTLIDGARPPRQQDLPAELHELARLNAIKLSWDRYQDDANRLLDVIQRVLAAGDEQAETEPTTRRRARRQAREEAEAGTADTLAQQRGHLDKTLGDQRTLTLNERFATAAGQLGEDKPPTVRLAGAYAMAGLADDWPENRQTCVDMLCGYLRMPYEPDPGDEAPKPQRVAFRASREVRHTVIRVITAHLQDDAAVSWQGLNFDFTGVVFDGGDFSGAIFSGGRVDFSGATFSGHKVDFSGASFSSGTVSFNSAEFSDTLVDFRGAGFSGGTVTFNYARFSDRTVVDFDDVRFSDGTVNFGGAEFSDDAEVEFGAEFSGAWVSFNLAGFSGGIVDFSGAGFSGGTVSFDHANFSGGEVDFSNVELADATTFSGGTVDFSRANDWSVPPKFPWTGPPPPGVTLPKKED